MAGAGNSISVIISTRNRRRDLLAALDSIAGQTRLPDEVVVVDASDGEETREAVASYGRAALRERLRYVRSAAGLTHQRNVGAGEFRGEIALFLDDDVILEPDYLAVMERVFEDASVAGASGVNVAGERSGGFEAFFRRFFMLPRMDGAGRMQPSGFPAWSLPPTDVRPVEFLSGYNMAYRREVLERFRFDEAFVGYGLMEDVEFSHRVSKEYRLVLVPQARLTHRRSPVSREQGRTIFRMRTFHHFLIYRGSVHRGVFTAVCFLWAHVGVLVWSLIEAARGRTAGPFLGYLEGLGQILFPGTRPRPESIQESGA